VNGLPATVLMTADAVGGVWSYALGLCAALPEIRFVVAVLGPPPQPAQRVAAERLANLALAEGRFRLEWMSGGPADVAASRRWLAALAMRHGADLVHVNGFAQARLDCGVPVVAVGHSDVLSWWRAVHGCAAPPEWGAYRGHVVDGLCAADRIVVPSHAALADLRRQYGLPLTHVAVIANGIDLAAAARRSKRPVVMAAGRIWDAAKNLVLLDRIAPDLAWPVEIAGDAAHPEQGVVRFRHARLLGLLNPAALRRRLAAAAIFAAPAFYEPFGLTIVEAAASGCALALGDIASLRENWDGAAVFLPPGDGAAWRAGLDRLIADASERRRLAAAARARAERFALAESAARYRALYCDLHDVAARRRSA